MLAARGSGALDQGLEMTLIKAYPIVCVAQPSRPRHLRPQPSDPRPHAQQPIANSPLRRYISRYIVLSVTIYQRYIARSDS